MTSWKAFAQQAPELATFGQTRLQDRVAYLGTLAKNTPGIANLTSYASIIRERSIVRHLIGAANEIIDRSYQPDGQLRRAP